MDIDEDQVWNGVAGAAALGAVMATRPLVTKVWKTVSRREAPADPAARDVGWGEAIAFAMVTGALVGLIRMLAQRAAAGAWLRAQGDYPQALRQS